MLNPFNNINNNDKELLLKDLEAQTYTLSKDTALSSEIILQDTIGIVIKGCLQSVKTDYNGNRYILEIIHENSIFSNSICFLLDENCDLYTMEDTTVIILDYYNIINHHSDKSYYNQFILNLFEIINNIVTLKNERISTLIQKTIRNRLLEYFEIMYTKVGYKTFKIPSTYTDLADYLAVDRSAMSREIKHLKEERIISTKGKKITLLYK